MIYCFRCPACAETDERYFPAHDVEGRSAVDCPACHARMKRDFAAELGSKEIRIPTFFSTVTASDSEPPELKGAGPYSKERRDFAEKTYGKNGRWV